MFDFFKFILSFSQFIFISDSTIIPRIHHTAHIRCQRTDRLLTAGQHLVSVLLKFFFCPSKKLSLEASLSQIIRLQRGIHIADRSDDIFYHVTVIDIEMLHKISRIFVDLVSL